MPLSSNLKVTVRTTYKDLEERNELSRTGPHCIFKLPLPKLQPCLAGCVALAYFNVADRQRIINMLLYSLYLLLPGCLVFVKVSLCSAPPILQGLWGGG